MIYLIIIDFNILQIKSILVERLTTASRKSLVQPTLLHNGFLNISDRKMPY